MKILVNEIAQEIALGSTVSDAARLYKNNADLFIRNGFPCGQDVKLEDGDRLVLIKKGEMPKREELEHLLMARHTPGVHEKLKGATVGIAGCGGLGSTAAVALARAGIGHLIIADFDVVEPSNLNRQQYFVEHIGKPKVEALKEIIQKANPFAMVECHQVRITPANVSQLFKTADIIVEAFDLADQKQMLVEAVQEQMPEKPLVIGNGMAGWGDNNLLKTRKVGNIYVCGDEISEAGPGMGLMAPRVGIAACLEANQVLEILLGADPRIKAFIEQDKQNILNIKKAKGERC
ncbi:MAG: sulfur carrier protein ThiS adenylyltransferase ThiF [Candidatus Edwardsbacteria bacterium]|nr:sulfur carrier protein ThiS adenylyltransferase ThiF [Candidatus Edwardsbacteria bacterium]MBU1576263.1 sulfur carrier protein ThiS adenylyltransferase ThiF [Candidatus Edwardsbacteria bacterium]MBU2462662.1 sulfur carrier protein ThiS adenylyltransferase ThiF [Candidatus Edwardsbacteria bacterium]MBU2594445.1 sulfur carrier protein ThiS adenylyltransferase ThiF [Candidatus Edwardsbacteria bacterium]